MGNVKTTDNYNQRWLEIANIEEALVKVVTLTSAATICTMDARLGGIFKMTPSETTTINCGTNVGTGVIHMIFTAGSQFTVTFGTGFKSSGTLDVGATPGKVFVLTFVSDGTTLTEVGRTAAM
jgi:hypothetical protein